MGNKMSLPTFSPGEVISASGMNNAFATLFNMMYPVGSIYMSATLSNASAVNNALPGTWEAWGAGRVPVGVDTSQTEFNTVGKTGGEKTHTLTVDEMPKHHHAMFSVDTSGGSEGKRNGTYYQGGWWGNYENTTETGGDGSHNNLQPYITCYMYKRVS